MKEWVFLKRDKGLIQLKFKLGYIVYMQSPKFDVKAVRRMLLGKAKLGMLTLACC